MENSRRHGRMGSMDNVGVFNENRVIQVTLGEVNREIDSLVGLDTIKKQLLQISNTLQARQAHYARHGLTLKRPVHFLIEGPAGAGKKHIATIIGKILLLHGLVDSSLRTLDREAMIRGRGGFEPFSYDKIGPIYLDDISKLFPEDSRVNYHMIQSFWAEFRKNLERNPILIGLTSGYREELFEVLKIEEDIHFILELPNYQPEEFLRYARKYVAREKFRLASAAIPRFYAILEEGQQDPQFANMRSVENIIDRAILQNFSDESIIIPTGKKFTSLEPHHFILPEKSEEVSVLSESDPLSELDALIGLAEVKTRIREISALVSLQRQRKVAGLPTKPISTHMVFSGSPGTGKTTVARLVGQIFKQIGVLEQGHLVEVAREDLVGQYVGHTAAKTLRQVDLAMGGVLFIDECYSLYNESERDFGHEAISTLVKLMEDSRDNLTVIFGGYSTEMDKFISMNPGLQSRIQFQIGFPDYHPGELLAIFHKLCRDESYDLDPTAEVELQLLLQELYAKRDDNFSNGRLVRSLFERSKLALALRTWQDPKEQSLSLITLDDIRPLREYGDIKQIVVNHSRIKRIGFIPTSA